MNKDEKFVTRIAVTAELRDKLASMKQGYESYESLIWRLIAKVDS